MRQARSPLTLQPVTSNEEIGYTWGDVFDRGKNIFKLGRVSLCFCVCVCFFQWRATATTVKNPSEFDKTAYPVGGEETVSSCESKWF